MKKKILITSIGGMFAFDIIKALRLDNKVFIVGTDINKNSNSYFLDHFELINDPSKNKKKYLKKLIRICKKYNINFILPGSDNECIEISKNHQIFDKMKIKTPVSSFEIISKLIDKHTLFKTLKEHNIDVGIWSTINSFKKLKQVSKTMGYPKKKLIIKPRTSSGSKGVLVLDSKVKKFKYLLDDKKRFCGSGSITSIEKEIKINKKNISNYIIMPYYNDKTFDVDCIAQKGDTKLCIPRLRTYKNPLSPINEGCIITNNKIVINYCKKIIKILNIDGVCDFDIILRKNLKPQIIDASCRLSGSTTASLPIGINVPKILVKVIFNEKISKIKINKNYQVYPKNRFELVS